MSKIGHNVKCFMRHMGFYCMEPLFFEQLKAFIMSETVVIEANQGGISTGELDTVQTPSGTLIVPIVGMTMKNASSFGGTSTSLAKKIIRAAKNDDEVKSALIHIDSPGGHVDGIDELAQEVRAFGQVKPIFAHADGTMASAAYWIGSAAQKVTASRMSTIGSLGTMLTAHDFSEQFEKEGIKTMVFSTGKYKGMGEPGSKLTKDQQEFLQRRVNEINNFFMKSVMESRGFDKEKTESLFDGSFELAKKAKSLGLIDEIQSFEATLAELEALNSEREGGGESAAMTRLRLAKSKRI